MCTDLLFLAYSHVTAKRFVLQTQVQTLSSSLLSGLWSPNT